MLADIHRLVLDLKTAPEAKCLSKVTIIRDRIRINAYFNQLIIIMYNYVIL